jgi:hypothetical protein
MLWTGNRRTPIDPPANIELLKTTGGDKTPPLIWRFMTTKELYLEICSLVYDINYSTNYAAFCWYSGHVGGITSVKVTESKQHYGHVLWEAPSTIYLYTKLSHPELKEVVNNLLRFLDQPPKYLAEDLVKEH